MQDRIKYARTYHLPNSPGATNDDKRLLNVDYLSSLPSLVLTEKLDGENFTGYFDGYVHARSLDSKNHTSRNAAIKIFRDISVDVPIGWRICCENVYAKHSIHYHDLDSYLYVISIWNEKNECLDWEQTKEWCSLLNLHHVPEIGVWKNTEQFNLNQNYNSLMNLFFSYKEKQSHEVEGFVIRNSDSFHYNDFYKNAAKYVRENHVISSSHWMNEKIIPNKLRIKND